jgi:putative Mg2+ transporter-C (MgtC) family protein
LINFDLSLLNDWLVILEKLSLSLLLGSLIGWERQRDHKPAGLRTHILVSLGSTMFVMIPFHSSVAMTHSQIIQGVAQGIGFLGAGEILRNPNAKNGQGEISGLTSAAATWVAAALGAIVGAGLYALAIFGAIFTLLTLKILKKLEIKS